MKYLSEFRDGPAAQALARQIASRVTRPWTLMEICGGQTHSILRYGIDQLLPPSVELVHGPGCPVCVTPVEILDRAIAIAARPEVTFCSFGDMLRVPGSQRDLLDVKAAGGDVRVLYSPLDAVKLAEQHPDREVVLFAIGFETTAPATAMAVRVASQRSLRNFSALVSHVLVPPAIEAILQAPDNRIDAFLAAGHVCCVTGYAEYHPLCRRHGVPLVVTGFEPVDLLLGIRQAIEQLEQGRAEVQNAYARLVRETGNASALAVIDEVFETTERCWRGLGEIPASGWRLRARYRPFDAEHRFGVEVNPGRETVCRAGEVLRGTLKPSQCPAFGTECTPRTPLGAPMVSSEGACAAYFHYGRAGAIDMRPPLPREQA
jgi:hydrogenase expression/formation protein HypD